MVGSLDSADRGVTVPATPAWTVHDVVCHLVGIAADLNAGNFDADGPDAWTASQVQSRRNKTVADLAAEWEHEALQFEDGLRILGYEIGSHYVADLLQHTADICHSLSCPWPKDDEALVVGLDFYLISFEQTLLRTNLGAVRVMVAAEQWTLGEGASIATVAADRFELFRALGGRRSDAQIQALAWTGDFASILPIFSRYPTPDESIVERTEPL